MTILFLKNNFPEHLEGVLLLILSNPLNHTNFLIQAVYV